MEKYSIFHIEGGLGKHVLATAVAKCIKNNHPDRNLIVVCAYPEAFLNLNFVWKVFRIGLTPYFYQDYIKDKDSIIFKHEPYFTTEHIHKQLPLIQNWCKLHSLQYNGEMPELQFNVRQKQFAINKWQRSKPVMVIQTNGGPLQGQAYPYSWTRDLPPFISSQIVDKYKDKYHIIQICREESQVIQGVGESHFSDMSNIELFSLLMVSEKEILIDSCLQHASAALGKSSVVIWVGTSPVVFGYNVHKNIVANLPENKLPDSYLFDYDFNGRLHDCPIMDFNGVFDINEIFNSIEPNVQEIYNAIPVNRF